MKKYLVLIFLTITSIIGVIASNPINAFLTYATFNAPSQGPYIETYLSIIGNSVKFIKNGNGKYQGEVDVAVKFVLNNEIKNAMKYALKSPESYDTTKGYPNFIDEHRYPLANGKYNMEISISDKNNPSEKPFTSSVPITINYENDKVAISDIQLLESYSKSTSQSILTKSGYDLVPYVSSFFPENINRIKFYAEIYNAKKILGEGQKMLVSYFIESYQKKTRLNDYSSFSKQTTDDVNILLAEFNIDALPSGNYNLTVEVKDKDNKVQAVQLYFFQRKNKPVSLNLEDLKSINVNGTFVSNFKSTDTLYDYIRSLRPISSSSEIQYAENQLRNKNLELMQQYFLNFWKSRNALQPDLEWKDYNREVMKENKEYKTFGLKGYDTDRGRVYLKYGPPNLQSRYDNEPSAYPYEIWQYDELVDKSKIVSNPTNRQTNKKFVFYNPDLVSNNYKLIYSNAIGEVNDARWEYKLYNRNTQSGNLDDEKVPDNFGSHVDDNFNNPR